jgi:hypothetical protein
MRNVRVLYLHTSAKCMLQSSSFSNALIDISPLTKTIGQDGQVKSRRMLKSMKPRRSVALELVEKYQDLMYGLGDNLPMEVIRKGDIYGFGRVLSMIAKSPPIPLGPKESIQGVHWH